MTAVAYMDAAELEELAALRQRAKMDPMTISRAADLWLGELQRQAKSDRTISRYRRLLDKLADTYPDLDIDEVTASMCRRFLDSQQVRRRRLSADEPAHLSKGTIAGNVSVLRGFFRWLHREQLVKRDPTERIMRPRLDPPEENDNVTTVTTDDVVRLLAEADRGDWPERLAVNTLVYLGPRRRAASMLRIGDYDPAERTLRFFEKGGRIIRKPVPDRLADLIDAAVVAAVYGNPVDPAAYLIPNQRARTRAGHRDDRIIWRLVKEVADRCSPPVDTHVHALRAAFAVLFLERHPDQLFALQKLMGHRRVTTTEVYLRRMDRMQAMDTVRDLDWSTANSGRTGGVLASSGGERIRTSEGRDLAQELAWQATEEARTSGNPSKELAQ